MRWRDKVSWCGYMGTLLIRNCPPPLGPRHSPTVGSLAAAVSYERGNPARRSWRGPCFRLRAGFPTQYRVTSPIRKRPPPYDPPRTLGIGLLWGPRGLGECVFLSVRNPCTRELARTVLQERAGCQTLHRSPPDRYTTQDIKHVQGSPPHHGRARHTHDSQSHIMDLTSSFKSLKPAKMFPLRANRNNTQGEGA